MSALNIPPSPHTVRLRALDTRTSICVSSAGFIQPILPHFSTLNLTSITFLIEHPVLNRTVIFDCGARSDFENYSPVIKKRLNLNVKGLRIEKDVHEILEEGGVKLDELDAMIWSHWHWDHHGAPEKYPSNVGIIVGPGFKSNFLPGYPTREDAIFCDANFAEINEVAFSDTFEIGGFRAHDFFGDGSFYLLDTPGHAIGHMCGLARTTCTTFVFLGGDICHFGGSFRPSSHVPLPDPIPSTHLDDDNYFPTPCPCSFFTSAHPLDIPSPERAKQSFFEVTSFAQSAYLDRVEAARSIEKLKRFDANPDVLVCIAHDPTLLKVLPFFNYEPEKDLKTWKEDGLKEKALWGWLNELPKGEKPGRKMLVKGVWRGDELVNDFEELKATIY